MPPWPWPWAHLHRPQRLLPHQFPPRPPAPVGGGSAINESTAANNSVGTAQAIAALPATVSGTLSTTTDTDYYKVTVPGGKKMLATLSAGSGSGFGLGVYLNTGQQLILSSGVVGKQQQILLTNTGATAVTLVVRVLRSAGTAGAYKLAMTI